MSNYSYNRTAASATPGLDAIAKKDLRQKLKQAVAKATKAADKAEDALSEGRRGKWTLDVTRRVDGIFEAAVKAATSAAYDMLDTLRPANSSRELAALKGMTVQVAREATMLIVALQKLDRQHYGPLVTADLSDMSRAFKAQAIHALWSQMDLVEKVYGQFRRAYNA